MATSLIVFNPSSFLSSRCNKRPSVVSFQRRFHSLSSIGRCVNVSKAKFNDLQLKRRQYSIRVHAAKQSFPTFDEMLKSSEHPVLVDFYATWCGPCQLMVPILEEVGHRLKDKIRVVKIDTEKYPAIASRYSVQALPTFILFKNGQPFDRLEGAIPADQLTQHIEALLKKA
eukprot:TRINITY_DN3304_c0_g1_i2.p1 TRINITY_DN3304_c0_g1~~TRINITY_DN3304_c0_g1_i2.p1  ORF type:complete len:171 (-),score=28.79 TRINITY_DN3304_c0_g1_i2:338-850(-)